MLWIIVIDLPSNYSTKHFSVVSLEIVFCPPKANMLTCVRIWRDLLTFQRVYREI